MKYIFVLNSYDKDDLKPEIKSGLLKLNEQISREKLPSLWKMMDKMKSKKKVPPEVALRRRKRAKIYGVFLILLGIFALVPGLMDPIELWPVLLSGSTCFVLGLIYFFQFPDPRVKKMGKAADELFSSLEQLEVFNGAEIWFSSEGMEVGDMLLTEYKGLQYLVETKSCYLLIWDKRITILQKRDLQNAEETEFTQFLEEKTGLKFIDVKE